MNQDDDVPAPPSLDDISLEGGPVELRMPDPDAPTRPPAEASGDDLDLSFDLVEDNADAQAGGGPTPDAQAILDAVAFQDKLVPHDSGPIQPPPSSSNPALTPLGGAPEPFGSSPSLVAQPAEPAAPTGPPAPAAAAPAEAPTPPARPAPPPTTESAGPALGFTDTSGLDPDAPGRHDPSPRAQVVNFAEVSGPHLPSPKGSPPTVWFLAAGLAVAMIGGLVVVGGTSDEAPPGFSDPSSPEGGEGAPPDPGAPASGDPSAGADPAATPQGTAPADGAPSGAPADGAPTDGAPTDGAPTDGAPADGAAADTPPGDTPPGDTAPADAAPADAAPADAAPADAAPADAAPAAGADDTPADAPPGDAAAPTGDAPAGAFAKATRNDFNKALNGKLYKVMRELGIRRGDDKGVDALRREMAGLARKKDYPAAMAKLEEVVTAVRAVTLDDAFLDAKAERLQKEADALDDGDENKAKIEAALKRTKVYRKKGDADKANKALNNGFRLLPEE